MNINISRSHIFNLLFFMYLLFYILGPAIINIYVTLLSISGLIYILKNYRYLSLLRDDQSTIILIIFFLYIVLKEFFYQFQNYDFIVFFRFITIFIFISLYLKINKNNVEINVNILFILLILICLDTFFQFIFGYNILGFQKFESYRLTSFFQDEPIVGSFLLKIFFPCLIYYFYKKRYIFLFFCFSISFFAILISGERMPFLQLLFGTFLFIIFLSKNKIKYFIYVLFFIIASIILSLNSLELKQRYVSTFNAFEILINKIIDDKLIVEENPSNSINDYILNFSSGFEIWKQNKIFGNGYRFYHNNCSEVVSDQYVSGCSTHPHNIYIELLSDHGILGLMIFIFFIYKLFINFFKKQENIKYYGFLISSIVISIPFVTSQSIFSSFYGSIFFFFLFIIKIYEING